MLFSDIYGEVIDARFTASQTNKVKHWINLREAQIWAAAEWPWKIVSHLPLAVETGVFTPTLPAEIQTPLAVFDDKGNSLTYLTESDFDNEFVPTQVTSTTGRPSHYKWNNGFLTLGVTPDRDYSFSLSYYRRMSHYAYGPVFVPGPMTIDSDFPPFGDEWHEILVIGAISTGLKIENDPTWVPLEQEFGLMLSNMADYYLPAVAVAGNMQYGADSL